MTAYVSNSVDRKIVNIHYGYGEIPLKRGGKHRLWALPGGRHTSSKQRAMDTAKEIDRIIRKQIKKPEEIL